MKKCYKCEETKDSSDFYKDITSKDGLSSKCKICARTFKAKDFRNKTEKYCPRCNNILPINSFDLSSTGDGYQTACKTCRNLVKTISQYPNLTWDWYHKMMHHQRGRCKICKESSPLQIDHCHETGKIRGLICGPCNRGLGHFRDRVDYMASAIDYLNNQPGLRN